MTTEGRVNPETGEVEEVDTNPDEAWEDVEPQVFKFEKLGDSIEGVYKGASVQVLDGEETTRHDIVTPAGPRFFWGSTTLDSRLKAVTVDDYIRIEHTELSEKEYRGGNKAKLYRVQRRIRS